MLQVLSNAKSDGTLEISLAQVPIEEPKDNEILVRMEAAPINPSDLGLLLGSVAIAETLRDSSTAGIPRVSGAVPPELIATLKGRHDVPMPVGNEGAGTVIKAGKSPTAQAMLGKVVGVIGGGTYAQFKTMRAEQCLPFPQGITALQAASWFVNPLTALGMIETMRMEGHKALIHTAAASNLGQMLAKICMNDGVDLVCIVRKQAQVDLLRGLGCQYVLNSSSDTFAKDLTAALKATGATLAFDATGGGKLAGQILSCMEAAASAGAQFSRYGTTTHKQVYIYGGLDRGPTVLNRNFGMYWGMGGWLLTGFLAKAGAAVAKQMRERVAAEINTTFKSDYTREISLREALNPEIIKIYARQATGEKFLINPSKDITYAKL